MSRFIKQKPADPERHGHNQPENLCEDSKTKNLFDLSECDAILSAIDVESWRMRTSRVPYTTNQLQKLEKHFQQNQFSREMDRIAIANAINLTPKQVKIWFQNRRAKARQISSGWKNHTPGDSHVNKRKDALKDEPKSIRQRTVFSKQQQVSLEELFKTKKYLSFAERCEIARFLKLNPLQVQVWFQNRRARYSKMMLNSEAEVKKEDEQMAFPDDSPEQIVSLISPDCYPMD